MNVLIAGVSSETQYVDGILSFRGLIIGPSDEAVVHKGATGLYARKTVCTEFLNQKKFDAILMLDLDMDYPKNTLARLREHDLDMVTGHYYRRQLGMMASVIDITSDGTWPNIPLLDVPHKGLHEVASTGMGCVLIKRHVIEAVAAELPPLAHPFEGGPLEWLTGDWTYLGTDKRFFAMARKLGYKLWLDAEVKCRHAVIAWIDDTFYLRNRNRMLQAKLMAGLWVDNLGRHGVNEKTIKLRLQALELEREHLLVEFEAVKGEKDLEELQPYVLQLNEYDNRMAECRDWITGVVATVKFPNAPEDKREEFKKQRQGIPDMGAGEDNLEVIKAMRGDVHRREAMEFVEVLDEREKNYLST